MTCIMGIVEDGKFYFACDSLVLFDVIKYEQKGLKLGTNNGMIYGCSGSMRPCQLILNTLNNMTVDTSNENELLEVVIPALINELSENNLLFNDEEYGQFMNATILVGFRTSLYYISNYFSVMELDDNYFSIGSGEQIVRSYLEMFKGLKPEPRFIETFRHSRRRISTIGGELKFEVFECQE